MEKYLSKALNSIINQKYKNWEVIFWDVSSSKKVKKFLSLLMKKDSNIFLHTKKNCITLEMKR